MNELTEFQGKCEEELEKRLEALGVSISDRKTGSIEKTRWYAGGDVFIEATIKELKVFIYEDGAEVTKGERTYHFEAPDFDTEDDLIRMFRNKIIALLQNVENDENDGSATWLILWPLSECNLWSLLKSTFWYHFKSKKKK